MDPKFVYDLKANDVVMEAMFELKIDQPISDRMTYVDSVLEATVNTSTQSQLVMKLYQDIMKHANIEFGKIPDSKGDLSRYYYYPQMMDTIEVLNKLYSEKATTHPNMKMLNRLHDLLLALRGDFEFGFKINNEFIQLTYNILVMSLNEMINICVYDYTSNITNGIGLGKLPVNSVKSTNSRKFTNYVDKFIKSYDKGEWAQIMHQFRTDASNFLGAGGMANAMQAVGKVVLPVIRTSGKILAIMIALLVLIRFLTYFFTASRNRLADYAKLQAEVIRANMSAEGETGYEAQQKTVKFLDGVATVLYGKGQKAEQDAERMMHETNKEEFTKKELTGSFDFDLA